MSEYDAYVFFSSSSSPFSQWYKCAFVDAHGRRYTSAEQYMMFKKAELFGDEEVAAAILKAESPRDIKALGRRVSGFDEIKWAAHREAIVLAGNLLKFRQNKRLCEALLATSGKQLVEASPWDRIWGIGLDESHARATAPARWPGKNLLGKCLDQTREVLQVAP
jgi:ribA/ribD-fused uncharacterized protein